MPKQERDIFSDHDPHTRHQNYHSSGCGRAVVPMWDSSDPERAPPPLPMNPSSPSLASKYNTSSTIQSVHAALSEKAWESNYTASSTKRNEISPERFILKGVAHKRIKSLQPIVKDTGNISDGGPAYGLPRSPEKGLDRTGNPYTFKDMFSDSRSAEKESRNIHDERFSERDAKFLREDKLLEKEPRNLNERRTTGKDTRFLREERSLEKRSQGFHQTRLSEKDLRFLNEEGPLRKDQIPKTDERNSEKIRELKKDNRIEDDISRSNTPSPCQDPQTQDVLKLRPSLKRLPQSILGENVPPQSATMLALQSMASKNQDKILTTISNDSTALIRSPQEFGAISNQILSLTTIATNLQKEMTQLSRRSKDNATDLVSLKEATNARDEDIRKSLRELIHGLNEAGSRSVSNIQGSAGLYIDNKAFNSPVSKGLKTFNPSRIPSPTSFSASLDKESTISSASFVADSVAIIALLEKVIREMSTKDSQEHLLSHITDSLTRNENSLIRKLDNLITLVKANTSNSDALSKYGANTRVTRSRAVSFDLAPRLEIDFNKSQSLPSASSDLALTPSADRHHSIQEHICTSNVFNEETLRIMRIIKDSVTQGGGLTAEVKALVRELRGEVLGMGREMGRKLDESNEESSKAVTSEKEHIARLLKNGIEDLKTHFDQILREHRRQSNANLTSKSSIDYEKITDVFRNALLEIDGPRKISLEKEQTLSAIKEAWERYSPETEIQKFKIEGDKLLTLLRESIETYNSQKLMPIFSDATREEIRKAIVEGLKHTSLPHVNSETSVSRDEILAEIKSTLEQFQLSITKILSPVESGITKNDMLDTLKEGLRSFDFTACIKDSIGVSNETLTRHDILQAVRDGLKQLDSIENTKNLARENFITESDPPSVTDLVKVKFINPAKTSILVAQVCDKLQVAIDSTRSELEEISRPAKHDIVRSSTNSDQVFDVDRDELGESYPEINDYSDKATGYKMKDTILGIETRISRIQLDLECLASNSRAGSIETILAEIINLRDMLSNSLTPGTLDRNSTTASTTSQEGLDSMRQKIPKYIATDISEPDRFGPLGVIKDTLDNIKEMISSSLVTGSIMWKDEILETLKGDLDSIKETILLSGASDPTLQTNEILNAIKEGVDKIKGETSPCSVSDAMAKSKDEILNVVKDGLNDVKQSVSLSLSSGSGEVKGEILEALKDGIDSFKEIMLLSSSPESTVEKSDILQAIDCGFDKMKKDMSSSLTLANQGPNGSEILNAIKDSHESFKATLMSSLFPGSIGANKDDILGVIREELESFRELMSTAIIPGNSKSDTNDALSSIRDALCNIKETISSSLVAGSGVGKEEILEALKGDLDSIKETILLSGASDPTLQTNEILNAIKEGVDKIKGETSPCSVSDAMAKSKDEILNVVKDGLNDVKQSVSLSLSSGSGEVKGEILEALKDGIDSFKEIMLLSSSHASKIGKTEDLEEMRDELQSIRGTVLSLVPCAEDNRSKILAALNDGLESVKETFLLMKSPEPVLEKVEILDAIKEGLESYQESALKLMPIPKNPGPEKDEVLDAIRDGLDNIKETMSTTLVPGASGEVKDEVLIAIKDGLDNYKESMLTSLIPRTAEDDKDKVLELMKDELEKFKDAVTTIIVPRDTEPIKREILEMMKDEFEKFRGSYSATLMTVGSAPVSREVLDAINDGLESFKESMSTAIVAENHNLNTNEAFSTIKDSLENITGMISSSMVAGSGVGKEEILEALKGDLDSIKETILLSGASDPTLQTNEILNAIKEGVDKIKGETSPCSVSDAMAKSKDEILNVVKDGLNDVKQSVSLSLSSGSGEVKGEILEALKDGIDSFKEIMLLSSSPESTVEKSDILQAIDCGFDKMKKDMSSSLTLANRGLEKDEILNVIKDGLDNFKESASTALVQGGLVSNSSEVVDVIKNGINTVGQTIMSSISTHSNNDKAEVLGALKNGLDGVRDSILHHKSSELVIQNGLLLDEIKKGFHNLKVTTDSLFSRGYEVNSDEILNLIKTGLDSFKESSLAAASIGTELENNVIMNRIKDSLNYFQTTLQSSLASESGDIKNEILVALNDGFESVKETFLLMKSPEPVLEKVEILDAIKEGLESYQESALKLMPIPKNPGPEKDEVLDAIRDGLDNIKETMSTTLVPGASGEVKDEVLIAIKDGLDNYKESMLTSLIPRTAEDDKDKVLELMKDELEKFKDAVTTIIVPRDTEPIKREILEMMKDEFLKFQSLLSSLFLSGLSETGIDVSLQALKSSLEVMKDDVINQQSMVGQLNSREMLNNFQSELSKFRSEIDRVASQSIDPLIKELKHDICDNVANGLGDVRSDIDRLVKMIQEFGLTQVNEKKSVISLNDMKCKESSNIEALLAELRIKINTLDLARSSSPNSSNSICRIDFADIENKLNNIQSSVNCITENKSLYDEDPVKKKDLEAFETLIKNLNANIDSIGLDGSLTKDNVNHLGDLLDEIRENINNLTNKFEQSSQKCDTANFESIAKDTFNAVENLRDILKNDIENTDRIKKSDVIALQETCLEIRNTISDISASELTTLASKEDVKDLNALIVEFGDQIQERAQTCSKSDEEYQLEIARVSEGLGQVKRLLEEFEKSIGTKLDIGVSGFDSLKKFMEVIDETLTQNAEINKEFRDLSEIVKTGLEKSIAAVVGSGNEIDEKCRRTWESFDRNFDQKIDDLLIKLDDGKIAAEDASKLSDEKISKFELALHKTQNIVVDLQLLANNISTSLEGRLEAIDKRSDKVLNCCDKTHTRLEEINIDAKSEQTHTRDDISKILKAIQDMDNTLKNYAPSNPISKDLCQISNHPYEQPKSSIFSLHENKSVGLPTVERQALPLQTSQDVEQHHEFNIQEKLDKLIDGMGIASHSFAQLDILHDIYQQLVKTAAEVSEFVTTQAKSADDDENEKLKATEEINNDLEKRVHQKQQVEATIFGLYEEEILLKRSINDLKTEQNSLAQEKSRLLADVSGLETALKIRREELDMMEMRAASLERRIFEGVIDHSRALLISKANKGREAMSRKRVPSHPNSASVLPPQSLNMTEIMVDMVKNRSHKCTTNQSGTSRRILSLNQISSNTSPNDLNRSHSVKVISNALRKNSWDGTLSREFDDSKEDSLRRECEEFSAVIPEGETSTDMLNTTDESNLHTFSPHTTGEIYNEQDTAGIRIPNLNIDGISDTETTIIAELESESQRQAEATDAYVLLYNE